MTSKFVSLHLGFSFFPRMRKYFNSAHSEPMCHEAIYIICLIHYLSFKFELFGIRIDVNTLLQVCCYFHVL